jgi:centromeric protein E
LGTVIGTLAENHAKGRKFVALSSYPANLLNKFLISDHVPYRNSKLTRLLQPSLSGDARISVICTINPDPNAVVESTSTLLFAQRVKKVHVSSFRRLFRSDVLIESAIQLCATRKEVMDTEALIERYRKEIEELKRRLDEREREAPVRNRRLSARDVRVFAPVINATEQGVLNYYNFQQVDESRAMTDLNSRIQQLTKLILTSQTVENGEKSRPSSPSKLDFDLSPYQVHLSPDRITTELITIYSCNKSF